MADSDDVVIGEGVVLDSASATVGVRILSGLIDYILLGLVWLAAWIFVLSPVAFSGALDSSALTAFIIVTNAGLLVAVPTAVETLTRGRSLGRLALGLRVVRDDGGPVGFRQAVTRALAGVFEVWASFGTVAALTSMLSQRSKRIGDMLAGTYVVRTRAVRADSLPLVMPAALTEWSRTVDIRRLPDGLALTARQFLSRAARLNPAARRQIGETLANRIAPYVSPLPEAGTHPETFIMGVLTTRRDREYALAVAHQSSDAAQSTGVQRLPFGVADVND